MLADGLAEELGRALPLGVTLAEELGRALPLGVTLADGLGEGLGVMLADGLGLGLGVSLGEGDGLGVMLTDGDGLGLGVMLTDGDGLGLAVSLADGDGDGDGLGLGVMLTDGDGDGDGLGLTVSLADTDGLDVAVAYGGADSAEALMRGMVKPIPRTARAARLERATRRCWGNMTDLSEVSKVDVAQSRSRRPSHEDIRLKYCRYWIKECMEADQDARYPWGTGTSLRPMEQRDRLIHSPAPRCSILWTT